MNNPDLTRFIQNLGYDFDETALLQEALQHSSYVNEQRDPALRDNERLEFLGDAVLDLVITHLLMDQFQESKEGDLSRMRATIVNETQLASIAQELELGDFILLGRGEAQSHGETKTSILADAMEAVIAAVYLDGGLPAAFDVITQHFSRLFPQVVKEAAPDDFKSRLQEVVQRRFKSIPRYRVVGEMGPDHNKVFEVRLSVSDKIVTHGRGKSKKNAEQAAAAIALAELEQIPEE